MSYLFAILRPALSSLNKKVSRAAVVYPSKPFLSEERRIALERWIRGREQCQKLDEADAVVVSFGKSGRTWLRVMLSRFYQLEYSLPESLLFGFDNLHYMNRAVPKIFFTHDNYVKDYTGNTDSKRDYYGKKVLLQVRHPADVAVSQYHQWRFRMAENKKTINNYPAGDVPIFDFVMQQEAGLKKVVDFMNGWASEAGKLQHFKIVRYEDMKSNAVRELEQMVRFIGTPGSAQSVEGAVEYASFENMRHLETRQMGFIGSLLQSGRLKPRDASNPESFKTRRGKVGGFRDYFTDPEVDAILDYVDQHLDSMFAYGRMKAAASA